MRLPLLLLSAAILLTACSPSVPTPPRSVTADLDVRSIATAYEAAVANSTELAHVVVGRTLGEDLLEAWYRGSVLVLARATYFGTVGNTEIDYFYDTGALRLIARESPGSEDSRTYFGGTGVPKQEGPAAPPEELLRSAREIEQTLRDYANGAFVPPPSAE